MPLDASRLGLIEQLPASGQPPIWNLEPEQVRAGGVVLAQMYGARPEMRSTATHSLVGFDGGRFTVRTLSPSPQPRAVIVYYHGGGWVTGDIDEFDTLGRKLAVASNCAVVMVDYRKAPEHRYPAAVEDAWSALCWTRANVESIAGQYVPLLVAGDSAGGNLAAVMSLRARDRREPKLAMQILVYPVTDSDLDNATYRDPQNQALLQREAMEWFWNHSLPDPGWRRDPEASPLRCESLAGLPPAVVVTAEYDPLRGEGEAYADRLEQAGVAVQRKRFDGQSHAYFSFVNVLPASADGIRYVAKAISRTR
ncbi:alpha/beta hydrolase [Nocardia sp. NPDC052278]|uniref:alpha/beta hydrolase n=1 Tax=unclassified Nocardia TaxID=2637762 RepID=UPI0036789787